MDHAFKGTRFPWTPERMEFVLNELVNKSKKYKTYSKLIEVYIILAGKIGATPRIVENFIKNLGRDYREMAKTNLSMDPNTSRLRGSNKIFRLFEEYNRIYILQGDMMGGGQMASDIVIDDDEDDGQFTDILNCQVKLEDGGMEEDSPQILNVVSMNSANSDYGYDDSQSPTPPLRPKPPSGVGMSPANTDCSYDDPGSPTPPPPPLPKAPKAQGRRSTAIPASNVDPVKPTNQVVRTLISQKRIAPAPMSTHMQTPSRFPLSTTVAGLAAANPGLLTGLQTLQTVNATQQINSIPQAQAAFQQPGAAVSSSSPMAQSQYIPFHVIPAGLNPGAFGGQANGIAGQPVMDQQPQNHQSHHAEVNKRPMKSHKEASTPHPSKRSRKSTIPLVSENLPDGMTEFERRYLQSMDTQNQMLGDISHELKLLRTGFFAIHSDEIAGLVSPNM